MALSLVAMTGLSVLVSLPEHFSASSKSLLLAMATLKDS
jgi:hypothetical protein